MSSQPLRIGIQTLAALRNRSKRKGQPISRLAERYIEEGLRYDNHPGVMFRDGPAGRRAGLIGGPDIWEIIGALRTAPESGEARVSALASRLGLTASQIRTAIRYYSEYPAEIDAWIASNDEDATRLESALERERELLG
jgi:hypothetical protein